jgi:hypothetical protein
VGSGVGCLRRTNHLAEKSDRDINKIIKETQMYNIRLSTRLPKTLLGSTAALAVTLGLVGSAFGEDLKPVGEFGWFGVGKAQQLEKGHIYWVGEFSGSFFSDKGEGSPFNGAGVRCPGFNDVDLNNKKNKAAGTCVFSDPSGADQAYLSWECGGDTHKCPGTLHYTGGTGRYQGISGDSPFTGFVEVNWPDGMASGYAIWGR